MENAGASPAGGGQGLGGHPSVVGGFLGLPYFVLSLRAPVPPGSGSSSTGS